MDSNDLFAAPDMADGDIDLERVAADAVDAADDDVAAYDAERLLRGWTPQQCQAVLRAAVRAGAVDAGFLEHFEGEAIEAAQLLREKPQKPRR